MSNPVVLSTPYVIQPRVLCQGFIVGGGYGDWEGHLSPYQYGGLRGLAQKIFEI